MPVKKHDRDRDRRSRKTQARILVVNDHPVIRETLIQLVNSQPDMKVCGMAADGKEALREASILKPNIAIIDLSTDARNGTKLITAITARFHEIDVIVMSMHTEAFYAERAFKAGARGFIVKGGSSQDMLRAVRSVLAGQVYFSG